jgi:hypothetical protein
MGHTLGTVTQNYQRFISYVKPFRRALRKSDQLALDALLDEASQHLPAASQAANLLPGVAFLLSLLLEKHKQVQYLHMELESIRNDLQTELLRFRQDLLIENSKLKAELLLQKTRHEFNGR